MCCSKVQDQLNDIVNDCCVAIVLYPRPLNPTDMNNGNMAVNLQVVPSGSCPEGMNVCERPTDHGSWRPGAWLLGPWRGH